MRHPVDSQTADTVWRQRLTIGLWVLVSLVAAIAFSIPEADFDLWGHLQFGRDALANGLPSTTTYSFTADGYRWINHENLSEIACAWIHDRVGIWALALIRCGLGLLIVGAIVRHARRNGVHVIVIGLTCLLTVSGLVAFWQLRPQLTSFACFTLLVLILNTAFAEWDRRLRWPTLSHPSPHAPASATKPINWWALSWAVPLMLVWTNSHGGFLAGLAIMSAYVVLRIVELIIYGDRNPKVLFALVTVLTACYAVTLVNPYGWELHRWLLQSLSVPRPEITEWHPIHWGDEAFIPFVSIAALTILGFLLSYRLMDVTQMAVLAVTLWQASLHQRHIPFFVILAAFWMPTHWHSIFETWTKDRPEEEPQPSPAVERWLACGVLSLCLVLGTLVGYRLSTIHVRRDTFPVSAAEFMARHQIEGRMVVTYNWAEYMIGLFGEHSKQGGIEVAFDGRFRTCYPNEIVDEHFDFVIGDIPQIRFRSSGQAFDPTAVLRRNQPDLVLLNRRQTNSEATMNAQKDSWALLYQDEVAQLWGHRDRFDDPQHEAYIPIASRQISDARQRGSVHWPGRPAEVSVPSQDKNPVFASHIDRSL